MKDEPLYYSIFSTTEPIMETTNLNPATKELTIDWLLSLLQHVAIAQDEPNESSLVWRRQQAVVLRLVAEAMIEKKCYQGKNPPIGDMIDLLSLDAMESLSTDASLSDQLRSKISNYLKHIPGYGLGEEYREIAMEKHGFVTMGLIRMFGTKSGC